MADRHMLIQALSRLAGNRHSDGTSSIVSQEDRTTIINGCHDLMIAARQPPVQLVRGYPADLTDDLREILSMMMWTTGPIAHALREGGQDIKRKAEDEQAEVMHWLIGLALEHGSEWRAKASDRIREIRAALSASEVEG
ncbi:hypothetical protein FHT77_000992 [Rhizobium sp. BK181]|uniref:hypothetical protein n=1 Tax=Rhizobium sp. BK181 TaxID=2587072 RepID=UPI00161E3867|nr:hypothetical protein [Rhizobium sp. BK181]MBB3315150.1 hypothetical protein [Rhizobium sp. BK181]